MSPCMQSHFLMRLILHQRNERINDQAVKDIEKRTRMHVCIGEMRRSMATTAGIKLQ